MRSVTSGDVRFVFIVVKDFLSHGTCLDKVELRTWTKKPMNSSSDMRKTRAYRKPNHIINVCVGRRSGKTDGTNTELIRDNRLYVPREAKSTLTYITLTYITN